MVLCDFPIVPLVTSEMRFLPHKAGVWKCHILKMEWVYVDNVCIAPPPPAPGDILYS